MSEDITPGIETALSREGVNIDKTAEFEPSYKVVGESKIPVSKHAGKMWKGRKDAAAQKIKDNRDAWTEAYKYYHHDQMNHRDGNTPDTAGNTATSRRKNRLLSETENVVFANVTALVPALYAKNPQVEVTSVKDDDDSRKFATAVERLLNTLADMKTAPGFNLKIKAKRAVIIALLTNRAHAHVGYTTKQFSSEQQLAELAELSKKLAEAKDIKTIEEIEGQLRAIDETSDALAPSGPWVRIREPFDVLFDADAEEPDGSDARYVFVADTLPTAFLNARFGQKDNETGQVKSIYHPTHVLAVQDGAMMADIDTFSLFDKTKEAGSYGYADETAFDKAKRTKVWKIWDIVTRRIYMYADNDWSWPIWVWDDIDQLDTFFPMEQLSFHIGPCGSVSKGEVTFYLDQQDAINEINDEQRRSRQWAKRNVVYNKNKGLSQADIEAILKGDDGTARGIDVPEGMKLDDLFYQMTPPSIQFQQLFDKSSKYDAIDRISGLNQLLRGGELKTNTPNKTAEMYASTTNMRVDEKVDTIEEFIGGIFNKVMQLCLMNMPVETVTKLIGPELGTVWRNLSPQEIRETFVLKTVAGSTQKPTSAAKKKEALEAGQVLGQFVNAAPATLEIVLRMLQQAFDEITITDADWDKIRAQVAQNMEMQAQKAAGPAQAPPAGGQPPGGGNPGGESAPSGPPGAGATEGDALSLIDSLSPQIKAALGEALKRGVPVREALQEISAQKGNTNG